MWSAGHPTSALRATVRRVPMPACIARSGAGSVRLAGFLRWGCPGGYQPGFVGEHDGLDAVAQAELGQDPSDVNLHCAFGQEQAGRDLAVGHAAAMWENTSCSR